MLFMIAGTFIGRNIMIGCETIVVAELVWSENINCVRISVLSVGSMVISVDEGT